MASRVMRKSAAVSVLALLLAGCGQSTDDATADNAAETEREAVDGEEVADAPADADGDPAASRAALAAENLARSRDFLIENAERPGVTVTDSGLQYEVLESGGEDGVSPVATDIVEVHYVGTLIDGVEFDSSRARGAAARFPLNRVIPGWTEGVQLMKEGDRFRFFVPSDLAYGENGTPGRIGPNDALIFDVELLKVINPERNLAASNAFLADNAKRDGVKTTESGLQYEILSEGPRDGVSPTEASIVKVNYEGKLIGGEIFDSSYERGEPIEFPLSRVIPGWTEGVQLMSVGDKFRFFLPPSLGYGASGTPGGPIGPNEALVFDVELLDVGVVPGADRAPDQPSEDGDAGDGEPE